MKTMTFDAAATRARLAKQCKPTGPACVRCGKLDGRYDGMCGKCWGEVVDEQHGSYAVRYGVPRVRYGT